MNEMQMVATLLSGATVATISFIGAHLKARADRKPKETFIVESPGVHEVYTTLEEAEIRMKQLQMKEQKLRQENRELNERINLIPEGKRSLFQIELMHPDQWRDPMVIQLSDIPASDYLRLLGGVMACTNEQLRAIGDKKCREIEAMTPAQIRGDWSEIDKAKALFDLPRIEASSIDTSKIEAHNITADKFQEHNSDCCETIRNLQGESWTACKFGPRPEDDIAVFDAGNGDVLEELRHIKAPPRRDPSWYASKMPPEKKPEPHTHTPLIEWAKEKTLDR